MTGLEGGMLRESKRKPDRAGIGIFCLFSQCGGAKYIFLSNMHRTLYL